MNQRVDNYNKKLAGIKQLEAEGKLFVIRPHRDIPVGRMQNNPQLLKKVYCDSMSEIEVGIDKLVQWLSHSV